MSARCGSCGEAIIWATTDKGKNMPINAVPEEGGNLAVHRLSDTGELRARALKTGDTIADWEKRGTAHWATCVNADLHRKKKATGRA